MVIHNSATQLPSKNSGSPSRFAARRGSPYLRAGRKASIEQSRGCRRYQVTHRHTRSDRESLVTKLTEDSHPRGRTILTEGVAGMNRSPFLDRSTMVVRVGCVTAAESDGSAPADSNKFVARATTMTAAHCTAIRLILFAIDITPIPQPDRLMVEG